MNACDALHLFTWCTDKTSVILSNVVGTVTREHLLQVLKIFGRLSGDNCMFEKADATEGLLSNCHDSCDRMDSSGTKILYQQYARENIDLLEVLGKKLIAANNLKNKLNP